MHSTRILVLCLSPLLVLPELRIASTSRGIFGAEIDELVRALVSRNELPPPKPPRDETYVFPQGFDFNEILRVEAVRDELLGKGVAAFPKLIDALGDLRYSYTKNYPRLARHLDVHHVCLTIMEAQLEICPFRRPISTVHGHRHWLPDEAHKTSNEGKEAMQKWWSARKNLGLRELQLEFVQSAVDSENKMGFIDKKEEAVVLGWYKPLLSRLKTGKPIRVAFDGEFLEEGELLPTSSQTERWYDKWFPFWEERWKANEEDLKGKGVDPNR